MFGVYPDATGAPRQAILLDGIPIAFKYDDFWSYSAPILNALQGGGYLPSSTFGTFDFSTGTGNLDVIIFTGAGTNNRNQNVGPGGAYDFQDPTSVPTGSGNTSSVDTWGNGAAAVNGPVRVGNVLSYLQAFNPLNTTPAFYLDWNQTGSGASILANAYVRIYDPTGTTLLHEWALDTIDQPGDGTYDTGSAATQVYNYGGISFLGSAAACAANPWNPLTGVGCAGVTADGQNFTNLDHNRGSGKPDFIVFAPTMNLSGFAANDLFVVGWDIGCNFGTFQNTPSQGCLDNGYEESFMTGQIGLPVINHSPEPGSLALIGAALAGLAATRRRRSG